MSLKGKSWAGPLQYEYDDDSDNDAIDGDRNVTYFITDVELEVQNEQYTKAKWHFLSSHLRRIHSNDMKERCKNQKYRQRQKHHAPPKSMLQ